MSSASHQKRRDQTSVWPWVLAELNTIISTIVHIIYAMTQ